MAWQMIRRSRPFTVDWGREFVATGLTESARTEIGAFYHRIQAPLYHCPGGGSLEQGVWEVDRWLDYHREHGDVRLAMRASTLVRCASTGQLVAVCLVNADEPDHVARLLHPVASVQMIDVDPAFRRRGLATRMLQRAMTLVAPHRPAFDLWVEEDNTAAIALYEKLDFVFTGLCDHADEAQAAATTERAMAQRVVQTHPDDDLWQHVEQHSPQTVGYIADPNDHGDYRCFVALDPADTFLGLCIIDIGRLGFGPLADQRVACLENILVLENCRRHGTGAALLRAALAIAWEEGADHVWWTVEYENTEAIAFYHAMGAAFIAEEDPDAETPTRYYAAVIQNPGKGRTAAASGAPCR